MDSHSNGVCHSCGGMVDAQGLAMGGDVEGGMDDGLNAGPEGAEREQHEPFELLGTDQQESTEDMREAAFANALSKKHGRQEGSIEKKPEAAPAVGSDDDSGEAMRKAKKERYGAFGGKR